MRSGVCFGLCLAAFFGLAIGFLAGGDRGTARANVEPAAGKIAFVSQRDGNAEIYVMNAAGTEQTRLTNNPADDDCPTWSPVQ